VPLEAQRLPALFIPMEGIETWLPRTGLQCLCEWLSDRQGCERDLVVHPVDAIRRNFFAYGPNMARNASAEQMFDSPRKEKGPVTRAFNPSGRPDSNWRPSPWQSATIPSPRRLRRPVSAARRTPHKSGLRVTPPPHKVLVCRCRMGYAHLSDSAHMSERTENAYARMGFS